MCHLMVAALLCTWEQKQCQTGRKRSEFSIRTLVGKEDTALLSTCRQYLIWTCLFNRPSRGRRENGLSAPQQRFSLSAVRTKKPFPFAVETHRSAGRRGLTVIVAVAYFLL